MGPLDLVEEESAEAALNRLIPKVIVDAATYRIHLIRGGTAERLERILQKAGYYSEGLAKIEMACRIAEHMEPQRNRSHSFQALGFCLARGNRVSRGHPLESPDS